MTTATQIKKALNAHTPGFCDSVRKATTEPGEAAAFRVFDRDGCRPVGRVVIGDNGKAYADRHYGPTMAMTVMHRGSLDAVLRFLATGEK